MTAGGPPWRDRWSGRPHRPDRRPPWWPEDEAWPPQGRQAWRSVRRGFLRRAALFVAALVGVIVLLDLAAVFVFTTAFGRHPAGVVFGIIVVVVLALVGGRLLRSVRGSVAPIGELIEASGRVEAGEFGIQVAEQGPGEVRALARAFNAMSARLAETDAQRRRLLADVSHELRTPLTVIQGNVEGMLDGLYPADRAHLERIQAETRHLEQLIEDLRTLVLADAGALSLHREATDLGQIAADAVAGFEPQASAAGVTLRLTAGAELPELELDARRVHQVIGNLVSNAVRHTPPGGSVEVTVEAAPDAVTLTVADTGTGMDAGAAAHAFDRFWRAGESAGAGLGLAIVRDLVTAHGGTVSLESKPGAGTRVSCRFPR